MTGSLQESAPVGVAIAAPSDDAAPHSPALRNPSLPDSGRHWLVGWLLMTSLSAIISAALVVAAHGKKGFFLATLATVVCLLAGFTDSRTGRIPNHLTYPAILLGLALNGLSTLLQWLESHSTVAAHPLQLLLTWLGAPGAGSCLEGLGLCIGIGLLGALLGGIHGGDLKLMAALGALLGFAGIINVLLISIGLALVYSLINLLLAGRLVKALRLAANRLLEWHFLRHFQTPLPDAEPYDAMHFPLALPLAVGMLLWQYWLWHTGEALL